MPTGARQGEPTLKGPLLINWCPQSLAQFKTTANTNIIYETQREEKQKRHNAERKRTSTGSFLINDASSSCGTRSNFRRPTPYKMLRSSTLDTEFKFRQLLGKQIKMKETW